jgi:hypothetical protein
LGCGGRRGRRGAGCVVGGGLASAADRWRDQQQPDGTLLWTSPTGQSYTTDPGSKLLFPTLCTPTAPVTAPADAHSTEPNRALMMPRRTTTRAHDRATRIDAERARNRKIREYLESTENLGNAWDEPYFPSRPPPPDETDLAPF